MALLRLIYVSTVAQHVRLSDAEAIARSSAERNQREGVTGFLLYTPGHFVQVLEGEGPRVLAAFDRIKADPRHTGVRKLSVEPVEARQFGDWSMGFAFLQHVLDPTEGAEPRDWDVERLLEQMLKAAEKRHHGSS